LGSYLVALRNFTDDISGCWVDCRKCFSINCIYPLVVNKDLNQAPNKTSTFKILDINQNQPLHQACYKAAMQNQAMNGQLFFNNYIIHHYQQ